MSVWRGRLVTASAADLDLVSECDMLNTDLGEAAAKVTAKTGT